MRRAGRRSATEFGLIFALYGSLGLASPTRAQTMNTPLPPQTDASAAKTVASDVPDRRELPVPAGVLPALIERYSADRGSLERTYFVPTSPEHAERFQRFYTDWIAALGKQDFAALSHDDQIDYLLFQNHLRHEQRALDLRAREQAETAPLLPFARVITQLEDGRRRLERLDPEKIAVLLTALNKQIEQTQHQVEAGLEPNNKEPNNKANGLHAKRTVANRAADTLHRLHETLQHWFGFYNGYDPLFTWWVAEPYKQVDQTLQTYAALLREKVVGVKADDPNAIIGDPIGREALLVELASEMIPYTPEELIALANNEFAWCEREMKRAAQEMGFGDDWKQALEKVKSQHVEPGKQPAMIRDLALEAIAFLDKNDLVTIPPLARETWRMEMMSPEAQKINPFFLGGEVIQVSYPTDTMSHEQKMMSMRGNNIHFARATVHHELIPGHHLQGFMMERYRPYRQQFSTPFFIEGWALYWEMLLWDKNFARSPEDRVGMLFWRMHRCARIIFSLNFHLEKMTPQECIDFLVNRVGHERANAEAEVRRSFKGDYPPLYQAAYLLGGLQIRALHHELVDSGKMTNRAFHDAILRENSVPIAMLRAALTQQKLTRDFTTQWKFYGALPAKK